MVFNYFVFFIYICTLDVKDRDTLTGKFTWKTGRYQIFSSQIFSSDTNDERTRIPSRFQTPHTCTRTLVSTIRIAFGY